MAMGLQPFVFDDSLAAQYVNRLWEQRQFSAAEEAWVSYLGYCRGIFRGPIVFLMATLNRRRLPACWTGMRWLSRGHKHPAIPRCKYHGNYSLRVQFEGTENLDFHHISQSAAVTPGVYRFQLYVKAAGLDDRRRHCLPPFRFRIAWPMESCDGTDSGHGRLAETRKDGRDPPTHARHHGADCQKALAQIRQ